VESVRSRLIGAAALAVAMFSTPMVASAQQFSFDHSARNHLMHFRHGSAVSAHDTFGPNFAPMRRPRAASAGPPMLIEIPEPRAVPRPRNVLTLPVIWSAAS
jgi:hypothetical protein